MLIAVGHGIVEFPLMAAIFFGFGYFFSLYYVKPSIGFAGGLVLLFLAFRMFKNIRSNGVTAMQDRRSPLVAGIVLSTANPYFLIWWATVGAAMVMRSAEFGIAGLVIFMICHWLCDFAWSWFLSALSFRGGRFFGKNFQKAIFAVSGIVLIIFSGKFIYEAVTGLL
jgi:threonine/homoserine/homoserine lactone efflux protein